MLKKCASKHRRTNVKRFQLKAKMEKEIVKRDAEIQDKMFSAVKEMLCFKAAICVLFGRIMAYDFRTYMGWKTGVILCSNFRDMGKVTPVVFGEKKCRLGNEKRPATIFEKATVTGKFG